MQFSELFISAKVTLFAILRARLLLSLLGNPTFVMQQQPTSKEQRKVFDVLRFSSSRKKESFTPPPRMQPNPFMRSTQKISIYFHLSEEEEASTYSHTQLFVRRIFKCGLEKIHAQSNFFRSASRDGFGAKNWHPPSGGVN